jgi:hypothetical protein
MSVGATPSRSKAQGSDTYYYEEDRGYGWMVFAGALIVTLGVMNIIEGIAAISRSHFFVGHAEYVFGDLKAWGWTVLILGIAQALIGTGIFLRNQFARWAGVVIASLNAIAQLLFIPAYPFWSLALFSLDILVIYGLVAYGSRQTSN